MSRTGLDTDGGISFSRKKNFEKKEEVSKPKEKPRNEDKEQLLRQERLANKLLKAKTVSYSGFAVNGGSIFAVLFALDSFVFDPSTLSMLESLSNALNLNIDFPELIEVLKQYKAHIVGFCISFQTMLMGYKDTIQKMKERDTESFYEVINDELGKVL